MIAVTSATTIGRRAAAGMRSTRWIAAVAALVGVLALPGSGRPARAEPARAEAKRKAEAKKLAEVATRKYNLGEYQDALDSYTRAYDTYPAPGLLFNIAQCHRGLRDHERAIRTYQAYLREKPDAPNRRLVEELIAEEEGMLKTQREAEQARQDEEARTRAREAEAAQAAAEAEKVRLERERLAAQPLFPAPEPERDRPRPSVLTRWWFWTAVGAVALAAGGGALYWNSQRDPILPAGSLGTHDQRQ